MGPYKCIQRTAERVEAGPLYDEFLETCADELVPAYADDDAWTGVRIFDLRGTNRIEEFPRLAALLGDIGREYVTQVNYFNMAPRSVQHAHRDQSGNLLFGVSRLHVALRTNPDAVLEVEHQQYHLPVGQVWSLDTSGLHSARNGGDEGRVHLVIDVKRSPATEQYFPAMTMAVRIHLVIFVAIMAGKLARDVITKPRTVLDRVPYVVGMLRYQPR